MIPPAPLKLRADVVGSLLRPPELLEARDALGRGEMAPAALKTFESRMRLAFFVFLEF